jgi:hypothetical protein
VRISDIEFRARKPFNVTLIQPRAYAHSQALSDAADYVHWSIIGCEYPAARTTNQFARNAHNVVFCAHMLPDEAAARIPSDSIIFNSEQLDDPESRHPHHDGYRNLLNRCFVWDYSDSNLAQVPHNRKCVVPFGFCEPLRRRDMVREAGASLLFYGSTSPRRQEIVRALQSAGISVIWLFGEYGKERDAKILRSWAVLNMHKHDQTSAFEPIRCFYPLINDVPVISEDIADPTAGAFRSTVFFFDRTSLVAEIKRLYDNRAEFLRTSSAMLQEFRRQSPLAGVARAIDAFLCCSY